MSEKNLKIGSVRAIAILLSLVCLSMICGSGCGIKKPYPEKNTFNLNLGEGAKGSVTPYVYDRRPVMVLGLVNVAALYEGRGLIYKVDDNKFESDFYNEFISPPSRLLADHLVRYLDRADGRFQYSIGLGLNSPEYGLEIYLEDFYGDYTGREPVARVGLKLTVTDMRRARAKTVFSRTYQKTVTFKSGDASDMVKALSEGLAQILSEFSQELGTAGFRT